MHDPVYNTADSAKSQAFRQVAGAYANAIPAATAPRELRVIERIEGLSGGIGELASRLEAFIARLLNSPPKGDANAADRPPMSIMETITLAEQRLRYSIDLVNKINDAF